ncbi:RNA-binding transcriptional accessory protein [Marinomonas sp. C2222]|uniref:RNA-binding transcriptional accessory protein n=1 Tax=Marinomonas sargassi TaxID=2984494 RepID=A0ABT2YP61_9GAMM|nr:Tex family protein [Marinomonas sargassi]MCV2401662.1 RNA-binding transcriptional accessory protein [Marinomonas sargassi]
MKSISEKLSAEFSIALKISENIIQLFEDGATVPFVARYRKEKTGGMNDVDLRTFFDRWQYLVDLMKRKDNIILSLEKEKTLSDFLKKRIRNAETKKELEDIYSPYKKTKRSKLDEAISLGLLNLAQRIWSGDIKLTLASIQSWCNEKKVNISVFDAQQGAESIILEMLANDVDVLKYGREKLHQKGTVISRVVRGKKQLGEKYKDYFDYQEPARKIPSHRLLALFRGKKENILKLSVLFDYKQDTMLARKFAYLSQMFEESTLSDRLSNVQMHYFNLAWKTTLGAKIESDVLSQLKRQAEVGAVRVFSENLDDLLMASPAGACKVLGADPGFKNGVKLAVVGRQGDFLDHKVIYLYGNAQAKAEAELLEFLSLHNVDWIALGNGTASRETELLFKRLIEKHGLGCRVAVVNEAGASVYSASPIAAKEFPNLDVTIRGAVSIARRFQDPLAELVKIEPQAIGVGQYQHDIKPSLLSKSLTNVVEDCVNRVGVDVNLASASLLSYVSGLTDRLAQNIVDYRLEKGRIESREELLSIKGVGQKCFEQCAGFIRVLNGKEPLDQSAVHPESYPLVSKMAALLTLSPHNLLNNPSALQQVRSLLPSLPSGNEFTYTDILAELSWPGRDPRPEFRYASFDDQVNTLDDLQEGMSLEGVVTNVAGFGAFVDIGVHQDGLIHISQLANRFIKDPRDIVRVGQVVNVTVLEVDKQRRRIALKGNEL